MTTTHTADQLATMTPAEVDTALAPLSAKVAELRGRRALAAEHGREYARRAERGGPMAGRNERKAIEADAEVFRLDAAIDAACELVAPYDAEFTRRGGWPRIFWCAANGGHGHRSLSCSTLRWTTQMMWLPELSGTDEAALVELAGERACTVCYPSAPSTPSQLRPAVEEREAKAARAAEREAARAVKAAKAITMPDGSPLRVGYTEARTVVSAWREGAAAVADLLAYSEGHPRAADWRMFVENAAVALAHKLDRNVDEVRAELQAKGEAKYRRDWK